MRCAVLILRLIQVRPFRISRCGRPARAAAPALLSVCPDGRFHLETRSEMVPNAPFAMDIRPRIPDLQQA